MSVEEDIVSALANDASVLETLGSPRRLVRGKLGTETVFSPPLILLAVHRTKPALESEEGILADLWECTATVLTQGSPELLLDALAAAMERQKFELSGTNEVKTARAEWSCTECRFEGSRMRNPQ